MQSSRLKSKVGLHLIIYEVYCSYSIFKCFTTDVSDNFMAYATGIISAEQHAKILVEPVIHTLTTIAAIGKKYC